MIFVSHANPEDNEFARWLTLRLAAEGYAVWCDVTKLLGGETFWDDIEAAIRSATVKFVFVLSRTSNHKPGARDELAIAKAVARGKKLKDFIIPVRVDDLPHGDINVEIGRLNAVEFGRNWATGLATLLEKLEEDGVPRARESGPSAVSTWWRRFTEARSGLRATPEELTTNWYPLRPATLYFHTIRRRSPGPLSLPAALPHPAVKHDQYLVSFAPAEAFSTSLGRDLTLSDTVTRRLNDPSSTSETALWSKKDERVHLSSLLRQCAEHLYAARALPTHVFAGERRSFYFTLDQLPGDRAFYRAADGKRGYRQVVGKKRLTPRDGEIERFRYWHFCVELSPTTNPILGFTSRPHVLFSDDGRTIWGSPDRLHSVRRSHCKAWWNDKWRDLLAASMGFLSAESDAVSFPAGPGSDVSVPARALTLISPFSFDEESLEPQTADDLRSYEAREDSEESDAEDGE